MEEITVCVLLSKPFLYISAVVDNAENVFFCKVKKLPTCFFLFFVIQQIIQQVKQ